MDTITTTSSKPKICVVGGDSGSIGMELSASLLKKGYPVLTHDRPETENNRVDRQKRKDAYAALRDYVPEGEKELKDKLQANWLAERLDPPMEGGSVNTAETIRSAIEQGTEIIALTVGVGRKGSGGNAREALIDANAPAAFNYGTQIADAYLEQLKTNKNAKLPFVINVGNPADAMTATIFKTIQKILVATEKNETDTEIKNTISATIKALPSRVLGMGGILDEARAVFAISELLGVPPERIRAPVFGPHNDDMFIDFKRVTVQAEDGNLTTPSFTSEQIEKINEATKKGGALTKADTNAKTGIDQSSVFASARGMELLIQALCSEEQTRMSVICYNPTTGAMMGHDAKVSRNGVFIYQLHTQELAEQREKAGLAAKRDAHTAQESVNKLRS